MWLLLLACDRGGDSVPPDSIDPPVQVVDMATYVQRCEQVLGSWPTFDCSMGTEVPITVTDMARPPGTRFSITCRMCSKSAATRERSSIVPIKTKHGIATNIGFCTAPLEPSPPQIRGMTMKNSPKLIRSK